MSTPADTVRVIQWRTGKIGQISIRRFAANPRFELVGVYTTSADKDGVDAGVLAGIAPLGAPATTGKEALIALDADCVNYLPLAVDSDDLEALLRSGKDVVAAVGPSFPAPDDARTIRLETACQDGGVSLRGGSIHPGFVGDILPLVTSRLLNRIDQLVITEVCDFSEHPGTEMLFGGFSFGRDTGQARSDPSPIIRTIDTDYNESIAQLATALHLQVDRYESELAFAVSDKGLAVPAGTISAGTVAGMRHRWSATVDERPAIVSKWKMADDLIPRMREEPTATSASRPRNSPSSISNPA